MQTLFADCLAGEVKCKSCYSQLVNEVVSKVEAYHAIDGLSWRTAGGGINEFVCVADGDPLTSDSVNLLKDPGLVCGTLL